MNFSTIINMYRVMCLIECITPKDNKIACITYGPHLSIVNVRPIILYLNKSFWLQSCLYRDFIYFLNLQLNMFGYFHVLIMMYNFILFFVVLIMTLIWIWNFNCRPNTTNSLFLMSMVHNMHPTTLNMIVLLLFTNFQLLD